jgi:hypothetical protein
MAALRPNFSHYGLLADCLKADIAVGRPEQPSLGHFCRSARELERPVTPKPTLV